MKQSIPSMPKLYSIGYATKPLNVFLSQLQHYKIDVIADVRSVPYSKRFHDYHREPLIASLAEQHIRYVYLGKELGPRSKVAAHYDEHGQIQFDRLRFDDLFLSGITRLTHGIEKGFTIAMLCAEKDPATCHRSLLVAYALSRLDVPIEVEHIDHTGNIETQHSLEHRLMTLTHSHPDIFTDESQCLSLAYQRQCKSVAYIKETS